VTRASQKADAQIGKTLIEVKTGLDAVRNLQAWILQVALALTERGTGARAMLVVAAPAMTPERLEEEWRKAGRVIKADLMHRLLLVQFRDGRFDGLPVDVGAGFRARLERSVRAALERGGLRLPRGEAYYEILKILVHRWMLKEGPMTSEAVGRLAGCSYPTVASAVRRLGASVVRRSYRRVELAHFPKEEWATLVAVSDRARSTMRFSDSSGQPRSADSLLRRLRDLAPADVGVGGVAGAKHYVPELDIVGLPRVDLTIHSPDSRTDLAFVARLDPALRKSDDPRSPVALVAHFVRRAESLFEKDAHRLCWADPVECLLDLHEARLEPQALEFLEHFVAQRRGTV
jgi:hypothetical protein